MREVCPLTVVAKVCTRWARDIKVMEGPVLFVVDDRFVAVEQETVLNIAFLVRPWSDQLHVGFRTLQHVVRVRDVPKHVP